MCIIPVGSFLEMSRKRFCNPWKCITGFLTNWLSTKQCRWVDDCRLLNYCQCRRSDDYFVKESHRARGIESEASSEEYRKLVSSVKILGGIGAALRTVEWVLFMTKFLKSHVSECTYNLWLFTTVPGIYVICRVWSVVCCSFPPQQQQRQYQCRSCLQRTWYRYVPHKSWLV
jgi:hypothetical protein